MRLLICTAVLTVMVVVLGVVPNVQNAQGTGVNVRPPACTAHGKDNLGSSNEVPDPNCTNANHPLTRDEKGGTGETGPYEVVPTFFKPDFPKGWTWGRVGGVFAESPDRIFVYISGMVPVEAAKPAAGILRFFEMSPPSEGISPTNTRRENIVTIFDRTGRQIDAWKAADPLHQKGSTPHRVRISPYDPEKHVWLVDEGSADQILKFTRDGKLVMRVQTKGAVGPADIGFLPNGDFYAVQRGRNEEPLIHYSKEGKELGRLGRKGDTYDAHCVAFDKRGRIYVGEMNHDRVQVFDAAGKSVAIWPNIRHINFCAMDRNEHLWVFDSDSLGFLQYDLDGRLLSRWGTYGTYPGRFLNVNQFSVDSEGNLYTAEPTNWRPQMFRPKKNAKREELIPQLLQ